jgi:WD40 repeat protein
MLVRQTEGKVRLLRFLPDGRRLVVVVEQSDLQMRFSILDTTSGDSIPLAMPGFKCENWHHRYVYPNMTAVHPAGEIVYIAFAGQLASFATSDGSVRPVPEVDMAHQVVISPRGDRLLVAGHPNHHQSMSPTVTAYDTGADKTTLLWRKEMPQGFHNLAGFLPDGERFVNVENVVKIRHVDDGRELASSRHKIFGHAQPRVSEDGRLLTVLGQSSMYIVDLSSLANPRRIKGSSDFGNFVSSAIHPSNGTMAVIHGGPTLLKIYSLSTLKQLQVYKWKVGELCTVDFSPDGMTGAVGSQDGRIVVWDVE